MECPPFSLADINYTALDRDALNPNDNISPIWDDYKDKEASGMGLVE